MLSFLLGIQDLSWEKEELNFVRCQYHHRSNKILLGAFGMSTFRGIQVALIFCKYVVLFFSPFDPTLVAKTVT